MTLLKNGIIEALDYNNLIGASNTTAAPSSAAATKKAGYLWGVGYGDRGYGQTQIALNTVQRNFPARATEWNDLRAVLQSLATAQGSSILLPNASTVNTVITGNTGGSSNFTVYDAALTTVDNNRLNGTNLTLLPELNFCTRATPWGTAALPGMSCMLDITFPSEDAARYFFNSGGSINVNLSHPNTSTPQNQSWNAILAALGTISLKANTSTRSGTGGTPIALGYYGLTNIATAIFDGTNIGGGAYSANDVEVAASRVGAFGANGGNGASVRIRVTLVDQHANTFSDTVAAGTKCSIGVTKAALNLSGIVTPVVTIFSSW